MLLAVAILLGVAWMLGLVVFKVTSVAFNLLVVLAVVGLVMHFLRGDGRRMLT
jgi:hypothetical protein